MSSTVAGLGANSAALQRALAEAAEKALTEGAEVPGGGRRDAVRTATMPARQRAQADAMIVELSERAVAEADGTLTAATPRPVGPQRPVGGRPAVVQERDARPQRAASPAGARVRELPLDQLVRVLKGSGIGFKEAVKLLGALKLDQPLPGKAVLRTMWDDAPADPSPGADASATRARVAPDVVRAPLDQLVRDKAWHRANDTAAPDAPRAGVPTLASVVVDRPVNQVYVAGLTTVEYQRLVVMLGNEIPEWFGAVRGARGLRGLMESRGYARLNTSRFAGMRLGSWCLGMAGMAVAWYAGLHSGMWW